MCKPVWSNIKKTELELLAYYLPEGTSSVLRTHFATFRIEMVKKIASDDGMYMIVKVQGTTWNGIRILWLSKFGGGGWVDVVKDAYAKSLMQRYSQEYDAANAMAL